MPPEGHRPIRNTDPIDESSVIEEAAFAEVLVRPWTEAVVLPHYRPLRRARAERAVDETADVDEGFMPESPPEPVRDAAAASFGEPELLEVVIGVDDRVRVDAASMAANPWRQICALRIRAANGREYVGTGWFIGPRVLATAGHCVYLQKEGGWPSQIEVIPAKNGPAEPFGRRLSRRFASVDGWVKQQSRDFDYGVIFLDAPDDVGAQVGNFEVEAPLDAEVAGATARISGYPLDRDQAEFQYYHERPIVSSTATRILYDIDTYGGQSGSPIWLQMEGRPAVAVGIHTTGGATSNSGTRISDAVLDNFIAWNEAS